MGVTISLAGCGVLLVTAVAWFGVVGHRKLDDALRSLPTAFKFD